MRKPGWGTPAIPGTPTTRHLNLTRSLADVWRIPPAKTQREPSLPAGDAPKMKIPYAGKDATDKL